MITRKDIIIVLTVIIISFGIVFGLINNNYNKRVERLKVSMSCPKCEPEKIIEKVPIKDTQYITVDKIIYKCNETSKSNTSREIRLIRELKACEYRLWNSNNSDIILNNNNYCNQTVTEHEAILRGISNLIGDVTWHRNYTK